MNLSDLFGGGQGFQGAAVEVNATSLYNVTDSVITSLPAYFCGLVASHSYDGGGTIGVTNVSIKNGDSEIFYINTGRGNSIATTFTPCYISCPNGIKGTVGGYYAGSATIFWRLA